MSELIADCPRCGVTKTTFDLLADVEVWVEHSWLKHYETFAVCRHCKRPSILKVAVDNYDFAKALRDSSGNLSKYPKSVAQVSKVTGVVTLKDREAMQPPEFLPDNVRAAYIEGAKCMTVDCFNAAATMFRLCIDLATRAMLPATQELGLNSNVRGKLAFRLKWLFETGRLPEALQQLSLGVKDDGNDGAHEGSLTQADATDMLEFATVLLERLFTEPEKLKLAQARRDARRGNTVGGGGPTPTPPSP